jgi:hypothetical protein
VDRSDPWDTFHDLGIVLPDHTFLMHDQKGVGIVQNDIINGIAGTVFAHGTVHDAHRRSTPVLRIETGFLAESLNDGFYHRALERAVNDDFALLLFSSLFEFRA